MKNLNNLIREGYDIFSGHQPKTAIDACTCCCMTEEDAKQLVSLSVDKIPLAVLTKYQDAATPEKLDSGELKYFAPRYLELIKSYQFPSFESVLSLTRFGKVKAYHWTKQERQLLDEFALAFFNQYLQSKNPKTTASAIDILLMFYKGKFDIRPLLGLWDSMKSKASYDHFQSLSAEIVLDKKGRQTIVNAFSDDGFNKIILAWLAKKNK